MSHAEEDAKRGRPQRILITLLGDYWRGKPEPIPSSVLVELLAEFGVGDQGARSALSRLTRKGLLRRTKIGRRTSYQLTQAALTLLDEGAARIFSFGEQDQAWDGYWSVVAFRVPEADRSLRHSLRTKLRWLGFAPLYDAFWISPHPRLEAVASMLDELDIGSATLMRATVFPGGPGLDVGAVFQLSALREEFDAFIARLTELSRRIRRDELSPAEALVARTEVMDSWRRFPRMDPDLPAEFLPKGWPRARARELFLDLYDSLAVMAEVYVKELVAAAD